MERTVLVPEQRSVPSFLEAMVKLIVGIVALALLERLAVSFPLVSGPVLLLSATDWIRLIAATGMILFFWLFTRETARLVTAAHPAVPEFANMMTYLGIFVAVAMGYKTYLPLVAAVLPEAVEGYERLGLLGAVLPFLALTITFFRRLDLIALAVAQGIRNLVRSGPAVKCGGCGTLLPAEHHFCSQCGTARRADQDHG